MTTGRLTGHKVFGVLALWVLQADMGMANAFLAC